MTVSDIKQQIKDLIGVDSSDTTVGARLLRWINNARRSMYRERDWDALKSYYQINRNPDYTTGTVAITQDDRVVTGSSTVFTAAMVGRYINFGSVTQSQWYRISKFNSSTEIVIEADYIGATLTASSYTISQVFYRMPAAARKIKNVSQFAEPRFIGEIGDRIMLKSYAEFYSSGGSPVKYQLAGTWGRSTAYSTGTLSGSQYGTVLTGDGTLWMDQAIPGDLITIAAQEYVIKSVDSDTQITLYAGLTAAAPALTAYEIATNQDSWVIRFDTKATVRELIPVEYYQHPFPLLNDTDSDFFIRRHPDIVAEGGAIWEKKSQEDATWTTDFQKWVAGVRGTMAESANDGVWAPELAEPEYE